MGARCFDQLGRVLTECASDGLTGVIRIAGEPGGVVHLTNGAVTAIDTPGAPGPEVILLRSGRVAESGWTAAFAAAAASAAVPGGAPAGGGAGGAAGGEVGAELVRRDLIGAGELEILLRTALADAMFALAAGELAEYEVDKTAEDCVLPLEPAAEPAWLLAETSRRLAVLASLPNPVEHDRDRWTSARGGGPAGLVLGTGQETILALANGRRTARDMAFVLGRGVYAVTLQVARMHAEGLLVPGIRRPVPGLASDSVLRPSGPEEFPQTVTPAVTPTVTAAATAAATAGEEAGPPPPLPRRRRGSQSQPRRARSVGQMDRAALLRLLRPGGGTDGDPDETM